jgi:tRNA (cmo5U34)-methyltransferase
VSYKREHVGDGIIAKPGCWTFSGNVCDTFDNHVRRSIPFYNETHGLIVDLARYFIGKTGLIYDLGCSTGTLCRRLETRFNRSNLQIIGVDVESSMCSTASGKSKDYHSIQYIQGDIRTIDLQKSDLIICCYILQFLPVHERLAIVKKIFEALRPGGGFVLVEKVRQKDKHLEELYKNLHHDFKSSCGYTDEEITAKDRSLKGILEPMLEEENYNMISNAGFQSTQRLFQHLCFQGWLGTK